MDHNLTNHKYKIKESEIEFRVLGILNWFIIKRSKLLSISPKKNRPEPQ